MFYRNTNHSSQINTRIVTLAAGLALSAVAVVGGSELLKESSKSNSGSAVTPRVERISPQFGSMADAAYASQGIRPESQFGTMADAVYAAPQANVTTGVAVPNLGNYLGLGQPEAAVDYALPTTFAADFLGLGQPAVGQSFGTMADAVYAVPSVAPQSDVAASVAAPNLGDNLGIGQPGEVSRMQQQFGTMADADFASR